MVSKNYSSYRWLGDKYGKTLSSPGKIRINLEAYSQTILEESCNKIIEVVNTSNEGVPLEDCLESTVGPIPLPTKRRIYCVLRSPHVNKDSREHFEIRIHKRLIEIWGPSMRTLQNLKKLDLSAGVDVKIRMDLP